MNQNKKQIILIDKIKRVKVKQKMKEKKFQKVI